MILLTAFSEDSQQSLSQEIVSVVLKGGIFLLFIAFLTRYILPKLLHALAYSTELLLIFAISWAITLAAMGDSLGFSKEVGACVAGVSLDTSFDWNLSDRDLTGELGTSYEIAGINTSATSNWDIDDFSYEGIDFDAGYTWQVADGLSLTPSVGMGFDSDWSRGDATASVAINLSFGEAPATE